MQRPSSLTQKSTATAVARPSALNKNRREASPMASLPTNANTHTSTTTAAKQGARSVTRSPSGSPLPVVELDQTTIALIKENEQMLHTITVLQHEIEKQKVRQDDLEAARASLANEVAELRSALGLATNEVNSTSGKVLNYKTAYLDLQAEYDKLKSDAEATKNKLEEATRMSHLWMQQNTNTARQQGQQKESFEVVTRAMNMPNTFLAMIQGIVAKLRDPAVRPADRRQKVAADIQRLESKVADYKPSDTPAVTADGVPQVDVPIRQCVHGYLTVIMQLLKDDGRH